MEDEVKEEEKKVDDSVKRAENRNGGEVSNFSLKTNVIRVPQATNIFISRNKTSSTQLQTNDMSDTNH